MNKNIFDAERDLFLPTYKRIPVEIDYGMGVYLFDKKGKRYLDMFAGLAVNALGYAHPEIVRSVSSQISKFAHLSNSYITDVQLEFTGLLLKYSGMNKAFLTNSGTEAVEAAIKMIRKVKGPGKNIIAFSGSFHGRTYGAMSLTARQKYRAGFEPLLSNIIHLPFNDSAELRKNINEDTAAVFIELIQGEGGINSASPEFVSELLRLRSIYKFIIAADEIQSGTGRTGYPFAYNLFNLMPEIVVTAKAIGGGLPLGALLCTDEYKETFSTGTHGTTFGGNPVSCAAGTVVLKEVFEKGLMQQVKTNGEYFISCLGSIMHDKPDHIKEIRGIGYMLGVEMKYNGDEIVSRLREENILINVTNNNVLRILPPLILEKDHIDHFISTFRKVLN